VLLHGFEYAPAGPHGEMAGAQRFLDLDLDQPVRHHLASQRYAAINTDGYRATPRLPGIVVHAGDGLSSLSARGEHWKPAIG
jgi:hypothetical protein